ncbi:hypothetical protein K437DRAFT_253563 [Tilletiaria anomala UBC 951]|uniref:SGF29 C-terminal domain-containing protein n=1 Tax=Tilletiaria anomala (strain ATCC 24038 / CBS 436.72 / UBC 951) TaxID=1037660 RepID=A0A066WQM5_TILAU|nr:uncharacterized protein K437DRAFT_253563 [Tilletiaria anomala UBC 951]KDN52930.1 hypothetical protein K437DRAFT_253563 [Tilletiaria anomala UBC 951]
MSTDPEKNQPQSGGNGNRRDEISLWSTIASDLRNADDLPNKRAAMMGKHESLRLQLAANEASPRSELLKEFNEVHAHLLTVTKHELEVYDNAIEKLGILQALLSSVPNEDHDHSRKRRRTDAGSPAPSSLTSPSPSARTSPAPVQQPPSPAEDKKHSGASPSSTSADKPAASKAGVFKGKGKGWRKGMTAQVPSATHTTERQLVATTTANTLSATGGYLDPAKARREQLAAQLPLQKGRKVAFRQPTVKKVTGDKASAPPAAASDTAAPSQNLPGAPPEEEGETWILATIIECINNDRNRYVVQDAEEDSRGVSPTWNTTLKAIVPLPETALTLPARDYSVGHKVLALYPDTSCFYQATVKGGGPGVHKVSPKNLLKKESELLNARYQLTFEDDNDDIKSIPAYLVVERPRL